MTSETKWHRTWHRVTVFSNEHRYLLNWEMICGAVLGLFLFPSIALIKLGWPPIAMLALVALGWRACSVEFFRERQRAEKERMDSIVSEAASLRYKVSLLEEQLELAEEDNEELCEEIESLSNGAKT